MLNKLVLLLNGPIEVGGDFICNSNRIESLFGSPLKVGGDFNCNNNNIRYLSGCSKSIGGNLLLCKNRVISLRNDIDFFKGMIIIDSVVSDLGEVVGVGQFNLERLRYFYDNIDLNGKLEELLPLLGSAKSVKI